MTNKRLKPARKPRAGSFRGPGLAPAQPKRRLLAASIHGASYLAVYLTLSYLIHQLFFDHHNAASPYTLLLIKAGFILIHACYLFTMYTAFNGHEGHLLTRLRFVQHPTGDRIGYRTAAARAAAQISDFTIVPHIINASLICATADRRTCYDYAFRTILVQPAGPEEDEKPRAGPAQPGQLPPTRAKPRCPSELNWSPSRTTKPPPPAPTRVQTHPWNR